MIQPQHGQQYPQAASAVSINIYEPKSYSAPQQTEQAPYSYQTSMYAMPQASAWANQPTGVQSPYQQYVPQFVPTQPVAQTEMPASAIEGQAPVVPQPQVAPAAPEQQAPVQTEAPAVNNEAQLQEQAPVAPMPEVKEGETAQKVDVDSLVKDLTSPDYNTQAEAITSVANFTQATPDIALQVATDPVKQSLADIVKADISQLPDTTPEQTAISEKQQKGEQLTPEEQAKLDELSPKNAAIKNKIFAMFSLAMLQKLSRDNEANYSEFKAQEGAPAPAKQPLNQLIGFNEISNVIQNDANPELQVAGIQALQYMATPDEKAEVETILQPALNSADETVKQTATDAIAKLNDAAAVTTSAENQQAAPEAQAPAEAPKEEAKPEKQAK